MEDRKTYWEQLMKTTQEAKRVIARIRVAMRKNDGCISVEEYLQCCGGKIPNDCTDIDLERRWSQFCFEIHRIVDGKTKGIWVVATELPKTPFPWER